MRFYSFHSDCNNVTIFYLDIIKDALNRLGHRVQELDAPHWNTVKSLSRSDSCFVTTGHKDIPVLRAMGFKHFIHWFQGLPAEEDFLQRHSLWRKWAMSLLDAISYKQASYGFYVSTYQIDFFASKFGRKPVHSFVMPCFNETINRDRFFTNKKYEKNTFCYVGSVTDAWQCFDETAAIYAQLESRYCDCFFKVLTLQVEEAKDMLRRAGAKNFEVKSVARDMVSQEIADCKFGFIIRDDIPVNHVATPTKLSNYLSNGVIPVFSSTLLSYRDLATEHDFLVTVDKENAVKQIEVAMSRLIRADDVFNSYQRIFDTYLNRKKFVDEISGDLNRFLNV